MKFKEYDQNTYSNSYKKLMILRESNPIEQNRCENDRNSWNPMKMINPTHFFSQKVCRINEIQWFPTPREVEWSVWIGFSWTGLFVHSTTEWELTKLNWTGLDWSEVKWSEVNWTETKEEWTELTIDYNWTEPNWTEMEWTEQNWNGRWNEKNWTETKDEMDRTDHWLQPNCTELNRTELNRNKVNWSQLKRKMKWTELIIPHNWTVPNWSELDWTELNWSGMKWSDVEWSEVECPRRRTSSQAVLSPWRSKAVLSPLRWRPWAPNPNYDLHTLHPSHFIEHRPQSQPKPYKNTKIQRLNRGRGFQRR